MKKDAIGHVYISELKQYPKLYTQAVKELRTQGRPITDETTVMDFTWSSSKYGKNYFWSTVDGGDIDRAKEIFPELFEDEEPPSAPIPRQMFKKEDQVLLDLDNRVYEVQGFSEWDADTVLFAPRTGIVTGGAAHRSAPIESLRLATESEILAEAKLRFPNGCIANHSNYSNAVVRHNDLYIKMSGSGLDVSAMGIPFLLINGHWNKGVTATLPVHDSVDPETERRDKLLEEARRKFRPGKRYRFKDGRPPQLLNEELRWQSENYISAL